MKSCCDFKKLSLKAPCSMPQPTSTARWHAPRHPGASPPPSTRYVPPATSRGLSCITVCGGLWAVRVFSVCARRLLTGVCVGGQFCVLYWGVWVCRSVVCGSYVLFWRVDLHTSGWYFGSGCIGLLLANSFSWILVILVLPGVSWETGKIEWAICRLLAFNITQVSIMGRNTFYFPS